MHINHRDVGSIRQPAQLEVTLGTNSRSIQNVARINGIRRDQSFTVLSYLQSQTKRLRVP